MSDALPPAELPEVQNALTKPSRGTLSSQMEFGPAGMAIKSLEQGMQLAKFLVAGQAAPKGWTDAQVFLAMQAGLEHGLGYTGGIQSFVIINNMPSWRGQAALGKIRASKVAVPGSVACGCEDDPVKKNPDGSPQLRGWCRGQRVGDPKPTTVYFTQQEAVEAGLWSSGQNWSKFKRRMLMWRAVGFLSKDLFSDVLGNFPIAEELLDGDIPDGDAPLRPGRQTVSVLATTVDAPSSDPLLAELNPAREPATTTGGPAVAVVEVPPPAESVTVVASNRPDDIPPLVACTHGFPADTCARCAEEREAEAQERAAIQQERPGAQIVDLESALKGSLGAHPEADLSKDPTFLRLQAKAKPTTRK